MFEQQTCNAASGDQTIEMATTSFLFFSLPVEATHAGKNGSSSFRGSGWGDDVEEEEGMNPFLPYIMIFTNAIIIYLIKRADSSQTKKEAQLQEEAAEGEQGVILVTAAAKKLTPCAPTGVGFVTGTDHAKITQILDKSIFRDTELAPGIDCHHAGSFVGPLWDHGGLCDSHGLEREALGKLSVLCTGIRRGVARGKFAYNVLPRHRCLQIVICHLDGDHDLQQ